MITVGGIVALMATVLGKCIQSMKLVVSVEEETGAKEQT
jgi:hypothetical protein